MRFTILTASIIIQVCLGGLYAWSTFVPSLKCSYGLTTAQTQIIFGTLIGVFTLTMILSGKLMEEKGPRLLLILSGLLFAIGYGIASMSYGIFTLLLLGIGVIVGAATGLGYVCPLAVCMRWFPNHKGLVTGIAVAGFGGGAVLLANVVEHPLEQGIDVLLIFRWIGLIYGAIVLLAGLFIIFPPEKKEKIGCAISLNALIALLIKDLFFCTLTCAMFSTTFAGLLVIGNLMPMALASGIEPAVAAIGISAFAIGNATGRIAWGRLVDRMLFKSVQASMFFLMFALAGLWLIASSTILFIGVSFFIGFGFGASFVIHAALVASHYGINRVGNIYPFIFLGYGIAGITGPVIGGWLYDLTGSYTPSITVSMGVVAVGLLISARLLYQARFIAGKSGLCDARLNSEGGGA